MKKKRPVVTINKDNHSERIYHESVWDCSRWIHKNNENSNLTTVKRDVLKALKDNCKSIYGYFIFYKEKEPKDMNVSYKSKFRIFLEKKDDISLRRILKYHNTVYKEGTPRYVTYELAKKVINMYFHLMLKEITESIITRRVLSPFDAIDLIISKKNYLFATLGYKKKFHQRLMFVGVSWTYKKIVNKIMHKKWV